MTPQIATSPDGPQIAFVAQAPRGRPGLWVRRLDAADAQLLRGTEDATYPFWSPDSRSIGFFAQGKLKIIDVAGGPARTLSESPLDSRGGAWAQDGTILFSPMGFSGLFRIPASGGNAAKATEFHPARGELASLPFVSSRRPALPVRDAQLGAAELGRVARVAGCADRKPAD